MAKKRKAAGEIGLVAADLDLVDEGGAFVLRVRNMLYPLSAGGFARLCRLGNRFKEKIDPAADGGPPYVVTVCLPYPDFGEGDQTTEAFHTCLAFADRATAELAIPALRVELESMGFVFDGSFLDQYTPDVAFDPVPEDKFTVGNLKPVCEDVAVALMRFRRDVVVVSSHDLAEDWLWEFRMKDRWDYADDMPAERFSLRRECPAEDDENDFGPCPERGCDGKMDAGGYCSNPECPASAPGPDAGPESQDDLVNDVANMLGELGGKQTMRGDTCVEATFPDGRVALVTVSLRDGNKEYGP